MTCDGRPPKKRRYIHVLVGLLAVVTIASCPLMVYRAKAQQENGLDRNLFYSIYKIDSPTFGAVMSASNKSSWPIFVGTPFTYWSVGLIDNSRSTLSGAYFTTVAEATTIGTVVVLKRIFRRERPYAALSGVTDRSGHSGKRSNASHYSFPSGHAAISFSMATSISMIEPQWYVIAPAYLLASAVSLSRVWLGVHFPSDILGGAVLGTLIVISLEHFRDELTPARLSPEPTAIGRSSIQLVGLRVRF